MTERRLTTPEQLSAEHQVELAKLLAALRARYGGATVLLATQFNNLTACIAKLANEPDLTLEQRIEARHIAAGSASMLVTICATALGIDDQDVLRCTQAIHQMNEFVTDDVHGLNGGAQIDQIAAEIISKARRAG